MVVVVMATDNVVYQVTHTSTQDGVEVDNVYFYQRGTGLTVGADALAEEWVEQVFPVVNAPRTDDITSQSVTVINLMDVTDTFTEVMSTVGALGNEAVLPPHDAVNFTLVRENASTRNGSKRMACIREADQEDGVLSGATILGYMADIADQFILPILGTLAVEWFFPVIVGRIAEGDGYRLPATLAEATVNAIVDCVFNPDISTQTSRKFGNGA